MHALIPACCGSFLQPSASAHLRGQVRNGPRDACTYACVLRFVSAAFTHHCVHVCLRGFVWVQEGVGLPNAKQGDRDWFG